MSTVYINKEHRGQKYVMAVSCPAKLTDPFMYNGPTLVSVKILRPRRFWFAEKVSTTLLRFVDYNHYTVVIFSLMEHKFKEFKSCSLPEVCDKLWDEFVEEVQKENHEQRTKTMTNKKSLIAFDMLKRKLQQ